VAGFRQVEDAEPTEAETGPAAIEDLEARVVGTSACQAVPHPGEGRAVNAAIALKPAD
jgi:hypothetical protein